MLALKVLLTLRNSWMQTIRFSKFIKTQTFYKERWINENGLEQRLIVTYSLKYRDYQREILSVKANSNEPQSSFKSPQKIGKYNQNDFKRFISKQSITPDGEIAGKDVYSIDADRILKEEMFDGYYGICTNLEDDVQSILRINHQRWEIEESFPHYENRISGTTRVFEPG